MTFINDLYQKAVAGNSRAESDLFDHLRVSFRIFVRLRIRDASDREDVVQTAVMKIIEHYRQTEIDKSFAAWAYSILRNEITEYYRSTAMRNRKMRELAAQDSRGESSQQDRSLRRALRACLKKMIETNPRNARVLVLHYQGFTTEEICQKMGISVTNLHVILCRSRRILKHCLEQGDIER